MGVWAVLLAPLIGVLLAVFGAGGGMLTVPLLTHAFGMPLKSAVVASLWIVATVSLVALIRQKAWRVLKLKLLTFFVAGGAVGSWLGAQIGLAISEVVQGSIFALLVWFVAGWMHFRSRKPETDSPDRACRCLLTLLLGILLGIVTGVLGVGGGFMMVPALIWLGISDYKSAVAHSLVLIVINAVIASATYFGHVDLVWQRVVWVAGLAAAGTVAGGVLMHRISAARLQSAFSLFLILVGALMLYDATAAIRTS